MARAIWSGVLTFGLVSVPVELYSATEARRSHTRAGPDAGSAMRQSRCETAAGARQPWGQCTKSARP